MRMTTWEHKHLQAVDEDQLEATLNRWGAQGWAVASIISWRPARAKVNVVLTRPTPQDEPVSYGVTEEDLRNAKLARQPPKDPPDTAWLREVEPPPDDVSWRRWQDRVRRSLRNGATIPDEPPEQWPADYDPPSAALKLTPDAPQDQASGEGIEPSQPALEASSPAEEHGRPGDDGPRYPEPMPPWMRRSIEDHPL